MVMMEMHIIVHATSKFLHQSFYYVADDNECDSGPCDTNASCNNTYGSYDCTCNVGYVRDGHNCTGKVCTDICLIYTCIVFYIHSHVAMKLECKTPVMNIYPISITKMVISLPYMVIEV